MQTFGWDTVFIVSNNRVNEILVQNLQKLLPSFQIALASDPAVTTAGTFRSWQLVEGGAGKLLLLSLTIDKGTLEIGPLGLPGHIQSRLPDLDALADVGETAIDGVSIVISLFLSVLPKPEASAEELAYFMAHVAHSSSDSSTPGFVTPVNVIDPSGKLNVAQKSLLGAAMAEFLVQSAKDISFAFASINLVPPGENGWLTPVHSDYCYMEKIGSSGYLAILSTTTARSIEGLPRTIDQNAIIDDYTGSYIVSDLLFLRNVILPNLPNAYQTSSSAFTLDESARAICNTRSFETISVKSGAITYYPVIDRLSISTDGEGLLTKIEGSCNLEGGIGMTFGISARNRSRFDGSNQTVSFQPDSEPQSYHDADIPWYYWFLGPIAVLITELVVKKIADSVASDLDSLASNALSITKNPPQSIQWTDARRLDVKRAGVNGAFFMMGQV